MQEQLAAITAAVVGVVANLAIWFSLQVLFREHVAIRLGPVALDAPVLVSLDLGPVALSALAAGCSFALKLGVVRTLGITAVAGLILRFAVAA